MAPEACRCTHLFKGGHKGVSVVREESFFGAACGLCPVMEFRVNYNPIAVYHELPSYVILRYHFKSNGKIGN